MEVEMMSEDVDRLMATVSRAAGRELDPEVWEDRQIMNHGCQILNRMGYGPMFDYGSTSWTLSKGKGSSARRISA